MKHKARTSWRWGKPAAIYIMVLSILYSLIMIKLLFIRGDYRWPTYNYNLIPFHTIKSLIYNREHYNTDTWVKNLFGNIVLFIPIGVFLPALNPKLLRLGKFLAAAVCILFLVESIQLVTKVGSFDIDDIILNTVGAAMGLAFMRCISPRLTR